MKRLRFHSQFLIQLVNDVFIFLHEVFSSNFHIAYEDACAGARILPIHFFSSSRVQTAEMGFLRRISVDVCNLFIF